MLPESITSSEVETTAGIEEVVKTTVSRIVKLSGIIPGSKDLKVESKFGLDGSGNHNYRQQLSQDEADLKGTT